MTSSSAGTESQTTSPQNQDIPTAATLSSDTGAEDKVWSRAATEGHRETDPRQQAWRAYFEATALLQDRMEHHLKDQTELSLGDYNVLLLLTEAPDHRLRMGQLAERMVFSPSRLTYQIKTLESRGLVRRQACADDRRGSEAELTDAGRRAFRRAATVHGRQVHEDFLDRLDAEEIRTVLRVFSRIGQHLENQD